MEIPELRFAETRKGRLAFQQFGEGDDVVGVPPLAQNIERAWEWPAIAAMLQRFGRIGRYVHYDKRGTGASDRLRGVPDHDERVDDMRAVMDAAGIERAHLFGNSDGGVTALLFAAAYPDRVRSVTLFGSGACTLDPDPSAAERARRKVGFTAFAKVWGTRLSPFVDHFAPSLAGDPAFRRWHQRYERTCCDSETLLDLLRMSEADVIEVCPDVQAPVLLLHRTGDRIVDVARSHEAAAALPDARVIELEGDDHLGYAGSDRWLDELERWIRGSVSTATPAPRRTPTRIVTLGRFAVERDGEEVPASAWGSRHARTIVKRLSVARGWPVTRDELFELLWPGETSRSKVGARLSVQLSTVRRVLGGGVVADRETVRLDLDEVRLDLVELDRARDDRELVAVHGGTFLPHDLDAPWAAATRAEVDTRFTAAAARVAGDALRSGRPAEATALARRMLDVNPLDLRAHELLVSALLDTDQLDAARTAHAAWVDAGDELGVHVPPLAPA